MLNHAVLYLYLRHIIYIKLYMTLNIKLNRLCIKLNIELYIIK